MKPSEFSKTIIQLVSKNRYSYLEAITEACQNNGVEYEKVKPLLTNVIMEHLTAEAQSEHLIPKTARLPL